MLLSSLATSYKIVPQLRKPNGEWTSVTDQAISATYHIDWEDEALQGLVEDTFRIGQVEARTFLSDVLADVPEDERRIILQKLNRGTPTLELRINLECDNACTHCFIDHREKGYTPSFDELRAIVDRSEPKTHITLTGGEPTLHPQFIPLVRYIYKTGRRVSIQTNGRAFKDPAVVDAIALYVQTVQIPIHSIRESVFDHITQAPGSFRDTIYGLRNLHGKIRVATQTVITRLNYRELESIADFIQDVLDENAIMVFTYPVYDGAATDNIQEVAVSYEEIFPHIQQVLAKYASKVHTHYIPACYLHPYLKDATCVDIGAAIHAHTGFDLREGALLYGDTNQSLSSKYIKAYACTSCRLNDMCPGTLQEYETVAGYRFSPNPVKDI